MQTALHIVTCRFFSKDGARQEQGSRKSLFIKSEVASCPVAYPKLSIKVCALLHSVPFHHHLCLW